MKVKLENAETERPTLTDPDGGGIPPRSTSAPIAKPLGDNARYRIVRVIGSGGMGTVYEAHDNELDRLVALKVIRDGSSPDARHRLRKEAQAMARLDHPNVTAVFDVGSYEDHVFIAMQLVRGGTLRAETRDDSWRPTLAMLIAAGRGLAAAHAAGVIHRDFKPENVLVGDDGVVRVADFGLASDEAHSDRVGGTVAYMAPECLLGNASVLGDQFAFCVTAFELLEGQRPYELDTRDKRSPQELYERVMAAPRRPWTRKRVPAELRSIIDRGMHLEASERWPSLDALLVALERVLARSRRRWVLAGVGALVVALVIVGTMRFVDSPSATDDCVLDPDMIARDWDEVAHAVYAASGTSKPDTNEDIRWLDEYSRQWAKTTRQLCDQRRTDNFWLLRCLHDTRDSFKAVLQRTERRTWPALFVPEGCGDVASSVRTLRTANDADERIGVFSRDGARIATIEGQLPVAIMTAEHGDLLPGPRVELRTVFGYDSNELVGTDRQGRLVRSDGRGNLTVLSTRQHLSASRDGAMLAVSEGNTLIFEAVDGREIFRHPNAAHPMVAWSGDNTRVAFAISDLAEGGLSRLGIVDLKTGRASMTTLRLYQTGMFGIGVGWIGPARVVISGSSDRKREELWAIDIDASGSVERAMPFYRAPYNMGLLDSNEKESLIFGVRPLTITSRFEAGRIATFEGAEDSLFASDATRREYLMFSGTRARIVDVRGNTLVSLAITGTVETVSLRAGRVVVVRSRAAEIDALRKTTSTFDIAEVDRAGGERAIATIADVKLVGVRCSAFSDRCFARMIDANDNAFVATLENDKLGEWQPWPWPHKVLLVRGWTDDITVDGRIIGLSGSKAVILDLATATTQEIDIGHPSEPLVESIQWAPDGRSFYYLTRKGNEFLIRARSLAPGAASRTVVRSRTWISRFRVSGPDDLAYSSLGAQATVTVVPNPPALY